MGLYLGAYNRGSLYGTLRYCVSNIIHRLRSHRRFKNLIRRRLNRLCVTSVIDTQLANNGTWWWNEGFYEVYVNLDQENYRILWDSLLPRRIYQFHFQLLMSTMKTWLGIGIVGSWIRNIWYATLFVVGSRYLDLANVSPIAIFSSSLTRWYTANPSSIWFLYSLHSQICYFHQPF